MLVWHFFMTNTVLLLALAMSPTSVAMLVWEAEFPSSFLALGVLEYDSQERTQYNEHAAGTISANVPLQARQELLGNR